MKGGRTTNFSKWSDKYLLLEVLKDTAATEVLHVRHRSLGTDRIIKSRRIRDIPEGSILESDILKNLHHPGIPVIYDVGKDEEYFYIIEEYIGGQSLADILDIQHSVSEDFLLNTAIALCDVMQYLHTREVPILYQDLKPEHIFFFENRLRLIDFGIAGLKDPAEIKSHYGTMGYAAPEQYGINTIDEGVDIYAYGRVLAEIAGHIPQPVSAWITTLISKAAKTRRKERFSSFDEIDGFLSQVKKRSENKDAGTMLLGSIAVAGSAHGAGTTHIAVALTVSLRALGIKCVYIDCTGKGTVISMEQEGCLHTRGAYGRTGLFLGELELGPGIDAEKRKYLLIKDYGTNFEAMAGDVLLFVVGGRSWQLEDGKNMGRLAGSIGDMRLICNQGNAKTLRVYSRTFKKKIYSFPTDRTPMLPGRRKIRLFKKLLRIKRRNIETADPDS